MFGKVAIGVAVDDFLSLIASQLHQCAIASDVGYFKVEGHTALLCAFKVAWAAQLQVGFGNTEAIVGFAHNVDTFACFGRQGAIGDKYAITLVGSAPHPTAQLVQLRQAKPLRIEYHHHRGVGHIHPHFDNRCGHQYLRFATGKARHLCLFLLRLHLSVYLAQLILWKNVGQRLVTLLQIL